MSDEQKIAGAPSGHVPAEPEAPSVPEPVQAAPPQPAPVIPAPAPPAPPVMPSMAEPVKAPEVAQAAPAQADEVQALRAQVEAELEKARAAREALEAVQQRQVDKARVNYLRQMGASDALSDEHLLTLAPVADPSSADGAAALQAWQQNNAALFNVRQEGTTTTAKIVEQLKTSAHGTWGPEFHKKQMRATFGGE